MTVITKSILRTQKEKHEHILCHGPRIRLAREREQRCRVPWPWRTGWLAARRAGSEAELSMPEKKAHHSSM